MTTENHDITSADKHQTMTDQDMKTIERQLYAEARDTARRSGRTAPDPSVLETVKTMADRAVAKIFGEGFDPFRNPGDKLDQTEYDEAIHDRSGFKQQVAYGRASLRDRSNEAAAFGFPPERPAKAWLLLILAILAVALTLAPTFHDLLFAAILKNSSQALFSSVMAGAMLGGFLAWGVLGRAEHPRGSSIIERVLGAAVGVSFGVGLYLMRLSVATTDAEKYLALGFAIVEASIVLLLELFAAGLGRKWRKYEELIPEISAAHERVRVAKEHLDAREGQLREAEEKIQRHIDHVHHRERDARVAKQMKEAARAIAIAGYHKGLEENRGHVDDAAFAPAAPTSRRHDRKGRPPAFDDGQDNTNGDDAAPWLG